MWMAYKCTYYHCSAMNNKNNNKSTFYLNVTGGRDKRGGVIMTFPSFPTGLPADTVTYEDLKTLVIYLASVLRCVIWARDFQIKTVHLKASTHDCSVHWNDIIIIIIIIIKIIILYFNTPYKIWITQSFEPVRLTPFSPDTISSTLAWRQFSWSCPGQ